MLYPGHDIGANTVHGKSCPVLLVSCTQHQTSIATQLGCKASQACCGIGNCYLPIENPPSPPYVQLPSHRLLNTPQAIICMCAMALLVLPPGIPVAVVHLLSVLAEAAADLLSVAHVAAGSSNRPELPA